MGVTRSEQDHITARSMSPPHLPSPAATPDTPLTLHPPPEPTAIPNGSEPLAVEISQYELCSAIEKKILNLTQDLYELEICAGDVVAGQEGRVPEFLRRINEELVELNAMSAGLTESVPRQAIE